MICVCVRKYNYLLKIRARCNIIGLVRLYRQYPRMRNSYFRRNSNMANRSSRATEKRGEIQMTQGSLWKNMLLFSIPLMLSQLLQVLFNMADVAVVGKFSSKEALGAVGSTTILVSRFPLYGFSHRNGKCRQRSGCASSRREGQGSHLCIHPHIICDMPCDGLHHNGALSAFRAVYAGTSRHKG